MTHNAIIATIVDFIMDGNHDQAAQTWSSAHGADNKCTPCFYSPLDNNIRCASCLESHLGIATLKRAYPSIGHDRLSTAHKSLDDWIRAKA